MKEKADKWFSKYQRLRHANRLGVVQCATCPARIHWTAADWGHYIVREHLDYRWNYKNGGPQCRQCNRIMSGNPAMMRKYIVHTYDRYNPPYTEDELHEKVCKLLLPSCRDKEKVARVYRKLFKRLEKNHYHSSQNKKP